MAFSSNGQIILSGSNISSEQVIGPILPENIWTHIVGTYSTINGLQLYINGTLNGTTRPITYRASGEVNILTLANPMQVNISGLCSLQSIIPNVYYGSIDELRVYSRELNTNDISTLANP